MNLFYSDSYGEILQFIAITIGANLSKEMWLLNPFGCERAPLGIRQVIQLLRKGVSQPTTPHKGMLQLRGPVDLSRSRDKVH